MVEHNHVTAIFKLASLMRPKAMRSREVIKARKACDLQMTAKRWEKSNFSLFHKSSPGSLSGYESFVFRVRCK
ncbi:hypothetical protein CEXT_26211 [Caerostris extrusa]|uniref:Uncharacterized protein n=1 Tax=Caerostris extrusa TaxID=172846 RepID=A0AAV4Q8H5_CAEEX|nr:hypothetical protein CEXT_26211 [Caerostris extrusa]